MLGRDQCGSIEDLEMTKQKQERWGLLKADVREWLNCHGKGWPKTRVFFRWTREKMQLHHRWETYWSDLQKGLPVPWGLIEALVMYVNTNWKEAIRVEMIAEEVSPPEDRVDEPDTTSVWGASGGWWKLLLFFGRLLKTFPERLLAHEKMFCKPDTDLLPLAEETVQWVARKLVPGSKTLDKESAQQQALEILQRRSAKELADSFRMLHGCDDKAVMFPVVEIEGKYKRAGGWVMYPFTDEAGRRFLAGGLSEPDIRRTDIRSPANYVFLDFLIEPEDLTTFGGQFQLSIAQAQCLFYQLAWLTRKKKGARRPTIMTIATNDDFENRLRRYGFKKTSVCMPRTEYPIMRFGPGRTDVSPQVHGLERFATEMGPTVMYWVFLMVLEVYHLANKHSEDWKNPRSGLRP
jgi:hypothetical protein